MEDKNNSGALAEVKNTLSAILKGKYYILTWMLFFGALSLSSHLVTSFKIDGYFSKGFFLSSSIFGISFFFAKHERFKDYIEKNSVSYWVVVVSVIICTVFFHAPLPDETEFYSQQTLANFGTFFGGILTPIGVFLTVYSFVLEQRKSALMEKNKAIIHRIEKAGELAVIHVQAKIYLIDAEIQKAKLPFSGVSEIISSTAVIDNVKQDVEDRMDSIFDFINNSVESNSNKEIMVLANNTTAVIKSKQLELDVKIDLFIKQLEYAEIEG